MAAGFGVKWPADFAGPAEAGHYILEASEPPEARGLRRDEVRLLVSDLERDSIEHARFHEIGNWLTDGDLLVVNTSGTMNAALSATSQSGEPFELHLSTRLPGRFWSVEVRQPGPVASLPYREALAGRVLRLPAGGSARLLSPYPLADGIERRSRLWLAALEVPQPLSAYLDTHGFPIRYAYVPRAWPSEMYQTLFATERGSAEMPSAGRPFTPELMTRLIARGVRVAMVLLHTGVASLEDHEPPYEEYYRVPLGTANRINATRQAGRRVIAVGTTVVRALETVTDADGTVHPGEGWTNVVITSDRPLRSADSLITGLHEPRATHLAMLHALIRCSKGSNLRHLERAYAEAHKERYLWHEFGDAQLILGS